VLYLNRCRLGRYNGPNLATMRQLLPNASIYY
jgi:hypothetical protein